MVKTKENRNARIEAHKKRMTELKVFEDTLLKEFGISYNARSSGRFNKSDSKLNLQAIIENLRLQRKCGFDPDIELAIPKRPRDMIFHNKIIIEDNIFRGIKEGYSKREIEEYRKEATEGLNQFRMYFECGGKKVVYNFTTAMYEAADTATGDMLFEINY